MRGGPWRLSNLETGEQYRWDDELGDWVLLPPRRTRPKARNRANRS